jgi:stage II sporulation protein D
MFSKRARRNAIGAASALASVAILGLPASAPGADWVIPGAGFGHGVGMSQYGAYGFAKHGRDYRFILSHYYRHTRLTHSQDGRIRVLLATPPDSVGFTRVTKGCGKRLDPQRDYVFERSGGDVLLRRNGGHKLANCGRSGTVAGDRPIHVAGEGVYRGKLKAREASHELLVINVLGLDKYARGVVANEVPPSWPQDALRAQAVAARSYALASSAGGAYDVYDDTRSQVYGGKGSETPETDKACRRTSDQVLRYRKQVATTYFFSTSGGQTESIQYGFPGSDPVPYLKSVRDPYDDLSPFHRWKVRYSQGEMESRLEGLFRGKLRKIDVLKRGDSPRIVSAKVVGSRDSSKVSGLDLQSRLGLRSTWAKFRRR